jgi:myo-inositol 2-dehydrogenase/D-chiro-inositol 1-dehydrogenase
MHSQAVRMWDHKDPWWLQCHGTFENGVVYDITQGFVYGQLSKDQTHNCYFDIIGTKGIIHMTHDFRTVRLELRGVTKTEVREEKHGGKNIRYLCNSMAERILGLPENAVIPSFRDAAIASEFAWKCLEDSRRNDLPSIGDDETLKDIRARRTAMTDGYGLLHKRKTI